MKIAITGGIAEGKSTVLGYVGSLGVSTFSADDAAREVFETPAVQSELAAELRLTLPITRDSVRNAIESDFGARRILNRVMHDLIWERICGSNASVVEAPLLIETCLQGHFEKIWVVTCGEAEQLARLTRRVGDERKARELLAKQLPTRVKCAFADRVLRTNESEGTVLAYVTEAVARDLQSSN